jgi:hypothetical protein
LFERYSEIFREQGTEEGVLSAEGSFAKKWGWYSTIWELAGSDITRFESITKLGVNECLTNLAYLRDKQELERQQYKKYNK